MAKVRIRAGRGKGFIWVDADASKWTGEEFRKLQAARKEAAGKSGIKYVTAGRGTGRKVLKEMPEPKSRPDSKGMTRTTGRGTGSRKSSGHK